MYLDTHRFLSSFHSYRRLRKAFNGSAEEEEKAPKALSGEHVYQQVKDFITSFEKVKRNIVEKNV